MILGYKIVDSNSFEVLTDKGVINHLYPAVVDGVAINSADDLPIDLSDLRTKVRDLIDEQTQSVIFAGFEFDGLTFSMSLTAQINWSNFPGLPEYIILNEGEANEQTIYYFPLSIMSKFDEPYSLAYSDKMSFYMAALNHKNGALQTGNTKKQQVNACTTLNELQTIAAGYGITI